MTSCCICGKRLAEEEGGYACDGCLRPREEWEQEIGDLAEAYKVLYEALKVAIIQLRFGRDYKWEVADGLEDALESVKVTP